MSTYGITKYGTDVYGLSLPPAYLVPGFTAQPVNYGTIRVSWGKPSGSIYGYRLLANRYGFPVNENDGTAVIDSSAYPGGIYHDTAVIPGTYHYYGMYVLADVADNIWIRSGVTGCLANYDFGSAQLLWDRLPAHFTQMPDGSDLTGDASGNSYLQQFLNILGWGFDYLTTQYTQLAQHLNDPHDIPVNDLWNLAAQVGLTYSPETPAYTMRKGVANQAVVSRERGTLLGLANEITIRTGWGADVQIGPNLMLDTDQSTFIDPVFEPWIASRYYAVGECVWTGPSSSSRTWSGAGYWYQCLTASQEQQPPGNGTSNTYWQCLNNSADFLQTLTNPKSSNPSTWQAVNPNAPGTTVPAGTLSQTLGIANLTGAGYAWNGLALKNTTASTQAYLLRSVSQSTADLSAIPDPGFEAGITVAAPGARPNPTWVPASWPKIMAVIPSGNGWTFPGQSGESGGKYLQSAFWTGQNCWVTRQAGGHSGYWTGLITPQGTGQVNADGPWIAVKPGQSVSASVWLNPASAVQADIEIVWVNSHGSKTGTPVVSTQTGLAASTWTQLSASGTAPSGAAYAYLMPVLFTPVVTKIDDIVFGVTNGSDTYSPDQADVIDNAIPVPWVRPSQLWNASARYGTGSLVLYRGQPFIATRASTGAVPPVNNIATPEWAPLSENQRIRMLTAARVRQAATSTQTATATPFAEWYDQHGSLIQRVYARNSSAGIPGKPANLAYDSFTGQSRLTAAGGSGEITLPAWQATFWANPTMTGPAAHTRTDPQINFTWTGSQPCQSVGISGWSARWTTSFTPAVSGTYTFTLTGLSGSRLIANGRTIIDNWSAKSTAPQTGSISLQAGTAVTLEVDYTVPRAALGETTVLSTGNTGNWTGNLLPSSWTPGALPASWTSPLFPVIAGLPYLFAVATTSTSSSITAQVSWYNGSDLISQNTITGTEHVWVGLGKSSAPEGANYASVYVSLSGSKTGYAMSFKQELTASAPAGLTLAAPVPFTAAAGPQYSTYLSGRITDDNQYTWENPVGAFNVLAGQVWPVISSQRSYALIAGQANTQIAVTLKTSPSGSRSQGIIFRYSSDTSYWRSDQTTLAYVSGGTWTLVATHSVSFQPGDRMTVELNGNSISVYRNGAQVSSASSSYNASYGTHGIIANDVLVT